jgi:hypothetical protein
LQHFERVLANIASNCEFAYGAVGRVGYLYESIKDQIRWSNLSVKHYVRLISTIGRIMSLSEKDYESAKTKALQMSSNSIEDVLIKAFGDGK